LLTFTNWTIRRKVVVAAFMGAALTSGIVGWLGVSKASESILTYMGGRFTAEAVHTLDAIDRNIFERYGDVQAFVVNGVINDQESWYKPDRENTIAAAMNQYVALYGVYDLCLLVDAQGKVIAVNSMDATGRPLQTASLYERSFAEASWFKACMSGTIPNNGSLSGTFVEDVHIDPLVRSIRGDDSLALGFSAPVRDANGKTIAVWKNFANFGFIEQMVLDSYAALKQVGLPSTELTLLDESGRIIVDCDPSARHEAISRDPEVLLRLNLAEKGVEAAKLAVAGQTGTNIAMHARKNISQLAGFTKSDGAMGFGGMGWSMLVRTPESEAFAGVATLRNIMIVVSALTALAVGGVIGWLTSVVLRPLVIVTERMRDIAGSKGDLTAKLPEDSSDEIGVLSKAFNAFLDKMREIVMSIAQVAEQVSAAGTQLSATMEQTSAGTKRQGEESARIASAVEEMVATVTEVTRQAESAQDAANRSRTDAGEGGRVVESTIAEIGTIATSVKSSVDAVTSLGAKSSRIGQIIGVIDDIADQTNLLALNAAIEAARAGEHGRGFAVVADEVRKLAERTQRATEEVTVSIKEIQDGTSKAVGLIKGGESSVTMGVEMATAAGTSLKRIVEGCDRVGTMINSIVAASREQQSASQEISRSISEIAGIIKESAATNEQSAQATELLSHRAEHLARMVGQFNTERRHEDIGPPPGFSERRSAEAANATKKSKRTQGVKESAAAVA
jgi:methyl-accepting chemotaxis protein